MSGRRLEALLWLAAGIGGALAIIGWRHGTPRPERHAWEFPLAPAERRTTDRDSLEVWGRAVVEGNPFRLERRPALIRYRAELEGAAAASPLPPPLARPVLSLSGIVGGPPWEALLDGVPGREMSVLVRQGDVLGDLTIRAVTRDGAVVQGVDTTWTLSLKGSWR